jgi:protein-disulfide isomerase
MSDKKKMSSKRKEIKESRRQRQRQQRLITFGIIGIVVLLVAILIALPSIRAAVNPVGTIVPITPDGYTQTTGMSLGNPNATVKVEVYEDFQCPNCKNFSTDVQPLIVKDYVTSNKIYYTVRMYPFLDYQSATQESHQAANAAECAADQSRFWDYEKILFANWEGENVGSFSDKRLVAFANSIGLDMNAFNSCFNSNKDKGRIDQDLALGAQLGTDQRGTPAVYVNGQYVANWSYDNLKQIIDTALAGK